MNFEWSHLKNSIKNFWQDHTHIHRHEQKQNTENDQNHVMTEEEKLDEALKETFPASDPPGHFSKSAEDKNLH